MTVEQLQQLTSTFGLKTSSPHVSKTQLIRSIQLQRGSEPCFSSEKRYLCTKVCEWRQECRQLKAQWVS